MKFDEFAERAEKVEGLSGDHDKIEEVARLLRDANDDLGVASRFIQGRIFPSWDERKLNIGPSLLYDALHIASGEAKDEIEELRSEVDSVHDEV
ncbi:MAG: DNA ligase, partial [Halobacteria archaeon]|nr:DNA ligase [Halobacteria archaeon]